MRNIKGFILFIIKLGLVIGAAIGGYWLLFWFLWICPYCPNAYDNSFQHALYRQYQALNDENRENELIVFGASYVPFGLDVEVAQEVTGLKTQTLGVEGEMGTRILIDIIRETAKPGDTICYVLGKSTSGYEDYITVSCAFESDKPLLTDYFERRGRLTQNAYRTNMIWRKLYALTTAKVVETVRSSISSKKQVYSLDSFDEYGNMNILREGRLIDVSGVTPEDLKFESVDKFLMDRLNELSEWCNENDVKFVVVYGMYMNSCITHDEDEIAQFDKDVREYLNMPVIMEPDQVFMEDDYFYNHMYHLNTEGAKVYSEILGNAVVDYLNGPELIDN